MTNVEQVLVKTCELQTSSMRNTKKETKLFSLNVRADRLVRQMELESHRAQATSDWSRYGKLQDELDIVNGSIKDMEEKMDAPTPEKKASNAGAGGGN